MTRAAASKGAFDLIGIAPTGVVLCQVKSNRGPAPAERAAMVAFPCPPGVRRLIHVWLDRAKEPIVTEL